MTDASCIREQLPALAEADFAAFNRRLIPGCAQILGVRMPHLRRLAKEILRTDWRQYLESAAGAGQASPPEQPPYMEESMLRGLVIGSAPADTEEILGYAADFINEIDNWAVCDTFCAGFKPAKSQPDRVWDFILPYAEDARPYAQRFAAVMLLAHYADAAHIRPALALLERIRHEDYYVRMAVAWALSVFYIRFPAETLAYLRGPNSLDKFTYNKALQKAIESRQISPQDKAMLRGMKRK